MNLINPYIDYEYYKSISLAKMSGIFFSKRNVYEW
jgi:hypothetical protein